MDAITRALEQTNRGEHPSRNDWDLFALSALSSQEHNKLATHLADCARCQDTMALITDEQEDWAQHPSHAVHWREIEEKLQVPPTFWERLSTWMQPAILAPVGALGLFALILGSSSMWSGVTPEPQGAPKDVVAAAKPGQRIIASGVRRKSSFIPPTFLTYFHRKGASQALQAKHRLQGGDILAFTYKAEEFRYLCLILLDRKGEISWLYPNKPTQSITLAAHGKLRGSVQLDGAAGPEHLLAFFSAQPLSPKEVKQLVRSADIRRDGLLTLPHQPAQTIYLRQLTIHKVSQ